MGFRWRKLGQAFRRRTKGQAARGIETAASGDAGLSFVWQGPLSGRSPTGRSRFLWGDEMTILANLTIAAPVTAAVTSPMQFAGASAFVPSSLVLEASFTYGSGGTSVSAWVQTSFDDQLT